MRKNERTSPARCVSQPNKYQHAPQQKTQHSSISYKERHIEKIRVYNVAVASADTNIYSIDAPRRPLTPAELCLSKPFRSEEKCDFCFRADLAYSNPDSAEIGDEYHRTPWPNGLIIGLANCCAQIRIEQLTNMSIAFPMSELLFPLASTDRLAHCVTSRQMVNFQSAFRHYPAEIQCQSIDREAVN
jgi:hypothetical protein